MTTDALLLLEVRRPTTTEPSLCDLCGTNLPRNRWGVRLPKRFPESMTPDHIEETLRIHPWLRGTRLAAMAQTLRDDVVMGA